ncbi:hypothetical protein BT93_A1092 [Corymbia citriodora subsp. variegata]|nr:hypothetical protein BT93_A1092 [Corymbia citriodora subsp. variegata]
MNEPPGSNGVVQIVEEMEAGDVSQIEQRDVEEAVGHEIDSQGTEIKSNGILIVKVVKKEETDEEWENHEVVMTPRVAQSTSWLSCCGLVDAITGSRTQFPDVPRL